MEGRLMMALHIRSVLAVFNFLENTYAECVKICV
jgi:hypothetical protein